MQTIGKVQEDFTNIEKRVMQVESRIAQMPTIGQITDVVHEHLRANLQQQVKNNVQKEVKAVVHEQVKSIIQEEAIVIVLQQLAIVQLTASPSTSYADFARTPPGS